MPKTQERYIPKAETRGGRWPVLIGSSNGLLAKASQQHTFENHFNNRIIIPIMSPKAAVLTDKAPVPLKGIYSQAIVANGTVYCSGSVAMDPATGKIIDGDIQAHTVGTNQHTALYNILTAWKAPMHQELDRCVGSSGHHD